MRKSAIGWMKHQKSKVPGGNHVEVCLSDESQVQLVKYSPTFTPPECDI